MVMYRVERLVQLVGFDDVQLERPARGSLTVLVCCGKAQRIDDSNMVVDVLVRRRAGEAGVAKQVK